MECIIDSGKNSQDSIYCEGICKSWLHRKCAGLSKQAFQFFRNSSDPFNCPNCCIQAQAKEIAALKKVIKDLQNKLNVNTESQNFQPQPSDQHSVSSQEINQPTMSSQEITKKDKLPVVDIGSKADNKFNVVMYGIQECPVGTSRSEHMKHDLTATSKIISELDNGISPASIRDCFRLGKFKTRASRPRPILIKLNRVMDVVSILSKRNQLPDDISVKPDMTKEEQQTEAILLKERWSASQQGISKKDIKIRSSVLYVCGQKYAKVVDGSLVKLAPLPQINVATPARSKTDTQHSAAMNISSDSTSSPNDNSNNG